MFSASRGETLIRRAIIAILALSLVACSEPLEFADWTIPVPEGARIIEYDDPPIEERDGRIELLEDLVVGARGDDPGYLFFRPVGVAVDGAGRMYVADWGSNHVLVYDADGEHLRTLGQEGQGPGEFQLPAGLTVAAGTVIVNDLRNRRLSLWDAEGAHQRDVPIGGSLGDVMIGTDAGSFVGSADTRLEDRTRVIQVGLHSIDAAGIGTTETVRYADLPEPEAFRLTTDSGGIVMPRMSGGPSFAAAPGGEVYATVGEQYQVLAFAASGAPHWALRAARRPPPFTEEHQRVVLDPIRDRFPDLGSMQIQWPEFFHAIGRLAVDGHGHLYVFPFVFRGTGSDERPVEVYSADGERLFAGMMAAEPWSAAAGDFVYALRRNEQSEEQELVRYRLVEPF